MNPVRYIGSKINNNNNGYNNHSQNNLNVGQRVTLRNAAFDSNYFDPRMTKTGVVIGKIELPGYIYNEYGILIALDYPLNNSPSNKELELTEIFKLPGYGSQTKLVKVVNGIADNIMKTVNDFSPNSLYVCKDCKAVKKAQCMLRLTDNCVICAEHIIPYNTTLGIPNVLDRSVSEMIEILSQRSGSQEELMDTVSGYNNYIVTKVLLNANKWTTNYDLIEREKILNTFYESKFYLYNVKDEGNTSIDISHIDKQIFKGESSRYHQYLNWIARCNAYKNESKPSAPVLTAYDKLLLSLKEHGYNEKDLKMLLDNNNLNDLCKMDLDMVIILIQSMKVNESKNSISNQLSSSFSSLVNFSLDNPSSNISNSYSYKNNNSDNKNSNKYNNNDYYNNISHNNNYNNNYDDRYNNYYNSNNIVMSSGKDISVIYQYPSNKLNGVLSYRSNMPFDEFIRLIVQSVNSNNISKLFLTTTNIPIYYYNQTFLQSLYIPIVPDNDFNSSHISDNPLQITIQNLSDDQVIYLSNSLDNFGPYLPILSLAMESKYNQHFISKVKKLSDYYVAWRSIRGDGNCYYRAVILSILEQILYSDMKYKFNLLSQIFESISFDEKNLPVSKNEDVKYFSIKELCRLLKAASEGHIWKNHDDFISDILNPKLGIDLALIRACRLLVSKYLKLNKNKLFNGISLSDSILPSYPDVSDMDTYCSIYVDPLGEDAEGPLVMLGILPQCLSCACVIVFLKNDQSDTMILETFPDDSNQPMILSTIHLLLRPGHYDLLYPILPNLEDGHPGISSEVMMSLLNDTDKKSKIDNNNSNNNKSKNDYDIIKSISDKNLSLFQKVKQLNRIIVNYNFESLLNNNGLCREEDITVRKVYVPVLPLSDIRRLLCDTFRIHDDRFGELVHYKTSNKYNPSSSINDDQYNLNIIGVVNIKLKLHDNKIYNWYLDIGQFDSIDDILKELSAKTYLPYGYEIIHSSDKKVTWDLLINDANLVVINYRNITINHVVKGSKVVRILISDSFDVLVGKVKQIYNLTNKRNITLIMNKYAVNEMILSSKTRLADLLSNNKEVTLALQYCESYLPCNGQVNNVTMIQDGCNHIICNDCLDNHLTNIANIPRPLLGGDLIEPRDITSIFNTPSDEVNHVPTLRLIPCPVEGCTSHLTGQSLESSSVYQNDLSRIFNEIDRYKTMLRTFKVCELSGILYCNNNPEPVDNFIQLGCGHFFHPGCLALQLKHEINQCKAKLKQIFCHSCEDKQQICTCIDCRDRYCYHKYTESEIKTLVGVEGFDENDKEQYVTFTNLYYLKEGLGDEGKYIVCNKGGCGEPYIVPNNQEYLECAKCNFKTCLLCNADYHEGITCEQYQRNQIRVNVMAAGEMLQACPYCAMLWAVPQECAHVVCNKNRDGCGNQYCFFCGAPYLATLAHSNHYHRPGCPAWESNVCCGKKCTTDLNLPNCEHDKYTPGPCKPCKDFNDIRTNSCTHTQWQPCRPCITKNIRCYHWCVECDQRGQLCQPPGPGNGFRIYTKEQVEAEQKRLA